MQISFKDWLNQTLREYHITEHEQRLGQFMFNSLYHARYDLSEQVRGTENDPFYVNQKVGAFLKYVERHW